MSYVNYMDNHGVTILYNLVCLVRVRYEQEASNKSAHIAVAMLECYLGGESQEHQDSFDLLEADFFDDESMVIVYRLCNTRGIIGFIHHVVP